MTTSTKAKADAEPVTEPEAEKAPVVDMLDMEFFDTLTGYDEHTIKKAWSGVIITKVGREDPSTWLRCLAFIHFKRTGVADPYRAALELSLGDMATFFRRDPDQAKNPVQTMQTALTAVVDASDLDTAQAAARKALETLDGGGAPGEAR